MSWLPDLIEFVRERPDRIAELAWAHARLSLIALFFATIVFMPLGVVLARSETMGNSLVGTLASFRVIPSLALIFLFYAWLGFGMKPAIFALVILAGPPILLNTVAGLRGVDPAAREAAHGMGMTRVQVFGRVEVPLALPVVIAGIRTASVEILASATLASFIGVKTLGQYIVTGVSLLDTNYLLAGAIPIMAMVVAAEVLLGGLERFVTPPNR
jgi:osmoprotectant transport system permease protein